MHETANVRHGGPDELARILADARRAAAFTGAGLSTESGVPDFRTPGSPWRSGRPIGYQDFLSSEAARLEAWRRKFRLDDLYAGAQPNRGHRALARLVANGKAPAIITQNIDGLQQQAGVPDEQVIELHGNATYARCLACGLRHELAAIRAALEAGGRAPVCVACGGAVKSATISFGQAVPPQALERARALALACDLFLVIGSSLVVRPAAALPVLAKRNGAVLVILNRETTPLDGLADLVIRGEIGDVLAPMAADAPGAIEVE